MIVKVENLTHRYGDRVALSGVSFETKQGEIFGLLGPNGGGKSTLFRILSTLMAPSEGRASICGHDVGRDSAAVRRKIGVVFQSQSLDKKLTVEENLRGQGHLHGMSGAALRERMEKVLGKIGHRRSARRPGRSPLRRASTARRNRQGIASPARGPADGRSVDRPRSRRAPRALAVYSGITGLGRRDGAADKPHPR